MGQEFVGQWQQIESVYSCVASDLSGFSANEDVFVSPAIKLEADFPLEIPYTNFAVECEQNGKRIYRKSFYNYKKDQAEKPVEAMESTPVREIQLFIQNLSKKFKI